MLLRMLVRPWAICSIPVPASQIPACWPACTCDSWQECSTTSQSPIHPPHPAPIHRRTPSLIETGCQKWATYRPMAMAKARLQGTNPLVRGHGPAAMVALGPTQQIAHHWPQLLRRPARGGPAIPARSGRRAKPPNPPGWTHERQPPNRGNINPAGSPMCTFQSHAKRCPGQFAGFFGRFRAPGNALRIASWAWAETPVVQPLAAVQPPRPHLFNNGTHRVELVGW